VQYEVNSPEEYLEVLEHDWRRDKLLEIRELIFQHAPDIDEGIKYKMLVYGHGDDWVFGLNAQKHYISLYVGDIDKIKNADDMLKAFNLGKGCIRIRKSVEISETGLEEFIKSVIEHWRSGRDVSC